MVINQVVSVKIANPSWKVDITTESILSVIRWGYLIRRQLIFAKVMLLVVYMMKVRTNDNGK